MLAANESLSLSESAARWETFGIVTAVVVAIAVFGEVVHDEQNDSPRIGSWWRRRGGKLSGRVLVLALFAEAAIQFTVNSINKQIISIKDNQTAELNKQANDAKLALATLEYKRMGRWTLLMKNRFFDLLKGKPTGSATIWYVPDNTESLTFAQMLYEDLRDAGWKVSPVVTIPNSANLGEADALFLSATGGVGGGDSIALRPKGLTNVEDVSTPLGVLYTSLAKVGLGAVVVPDPARAENDILIIIGPKP